MTETEKIFKENVKRLREESGQSKYKICKEAQIDYSQYSRFENPNKESQPGFETMEKIAHFHEIPVYELLKKNV